MAAARRVDAIRWRRAGTALLLAVLLGCEGTETTNPVVDPGVAGRMVDGLGRPVEGATVKAIPEGRSAVEGSDPSDSSVTDAQGRYRIEGLPRGAYNVIGEYNRRGLAVIRPGVDYLGPTTYLFLGVDTLRAPGQIQGSVTLGGKPREGVFCYLPGTSYLSISDDNGGCWLGNVPAGRYTVKYAQPGLQTVSDTGVVVRPGEITRLPAKELGLDTAFPPPAPDSLRLEQDTGAGTVTLRWSRVAVADLDGYWVYRNGAGEDEPKRIHDKLVRDTVFVDTVFRDKADMDPKHLVYRVRSQDREALLSATYGPARAITAEPPFLVRPLAVFRAPDTVSRNDRVRIIADFRLTRGTVDSIHWDRASRDTATYLKGRSHGFADGSDTLDINVDDIPPQPLDPRVRKCQYLSLWANGRRWRDSVSIRVIADPPKAQAMRDTAVQVGESFTLRGTGQDRFGRIVSYMWDVDNDKSWDYMSRDTGDFTLKFATGGRRTAVFQVTDDDQEIARDTVNIDVGSILAMGSLPRDTLLRKAGNPWWVRHPLEIPDGVRLEVEPGVILRFAPKAGLRVRGVLAARGTADDSIRMEALGAHLFQLGESQPGVHFQGPPEGPADTGSVLSHVSFRDAQVRIENSRPRIEHSGFRAGHAEPLLLHESGLLFLSPGRPAGEWVCQGNAFAGFPVRVLVEDLRSAPQAGATPHRMVLFRENRITGDAGLRIENSNRDSAAMEFLGNTLELSPPLIGENAGFGLSGTSRVLIAGNRVSGADAAVRVLLDSEAEIARNEFAGNRIVFRFAPPPGEGFSDFSGRFHHNRLAGTREACFQFAVHATGVFDSNAVSEDSAVLVRDDFRAGSSSLHPGRDLDFRSNHWSSGGSVLDAEGVTRKIQLSEAARAVEFGRVLVDPVLPAPPPGAGRP